MSYYHNVIINFGLMRIPSLKLSRGIRLVFLILAPFRLTFKVTPLHIVESRSHQNGIKSETVVLRSKSKLRYLWVVATELCPKSLDI